LNADNPSLFLQVVERRPPKPLVSYRRATMAHHLAGVTDETIVNIVDLDACSGCG
jgi:lactate dehydrogenase-like 2-hydroxyacid dehydrogenase